MHHIAQALALLPLTMLPLRPALAQRGAPPDSATRVSTMVVTATRSEKTLVQMPLHTSVISREEIRASPAQSLDQLLREIPGVNLSGAPFYTTDPTGHQTRIRGVTNSKVLVLLDGIPVHDPFYGTTQWFKVPLSAVERVEVIRGGSSSTWGNLAVAGVVNIISRKPFDRSGLLDVSRQSFNTSALALSTNWVLPRSVALRLSGDLLDTDGYQTTPAAFLSTVPGKGSSSARNYNVQLAGYYTPDDDLSAFVRAGYHRQYEDIGGYVFGGNRQQGPALAAGLVKSLGGKSRLDLRGWGQAIDFDKGNGAGCYLASPTACNTTATTSPLVQYANSHDDNPSRELGGSATLSWRELAAVIPGLQLGVDVRSVAGEDRAITYNRPSTVSASSATINRTNRGEGAQRFVGAFGQLTVTPVRNLSTTFSLRYDTWANTDGVSEMTRYTSGVPGTPTGGAIQDSRRRSWNPSLSARYAFGERLSVRGAAYRAFRAPGLNNLYRSFSSTTSITIANPQLGTETLNGGEGGVDWRAGPVSLGATWFRYDTRSLIASYRIQNAASAPPAVIAICGSTLSNCPATVNFNTNGQDARSDGVELTGEWRPANALAVHAAFTRTDSRYTKTTTGDPVGRQIGAVPRDVVTVGANWRPVSRVRLYLSARHSDRMFLDVNGTIPQDAFTLYNASASLDVSSALELYGSAVNLGNAEYSDNATTSAASKTLGMGRSITSGLRLKF